MQTLRVCDTNVAGQAPTCVNFFLGELEEGRAYDAGERHVSGSLDKIHPQLFGSVKHDRKSTSRLFVSANDRSRKLRTVVCSFYCNVLF